MQLCCQTVDAYHSRVGFVYSGSWGTGVFGEGSDDTSGGRFIDRVTIKIKPSKYVLEEDARGNKH